jgi:hypothetical protein
MERRLLAVEDAASEVREASALTRTLVAGAASGAVDPTRCSDGRARIDRRQTRRVEARIAGKRLRRRPSAAQQPRGVFTRLSMSRVRTSVFVMGRE